MKTLFEMNLKTGEMRTVRDGKRYSGDAGFIESQRDMLIEFRDDGRRPSQELLDDIAAYDYVLSHGLIREYMEWRRSDEGRPGKARPRHFPLWRDRP